jgi:hypothetical protein
MDPYINYAGEVFQNPSACQVADFINSLVWYGYLGFLALCVISLIAIAIICIASGDSWFDFDSDSL